MVVSRLWELSYTEFDSFILHMILRQLCHLFCSMRTVISGPCWFLLCSLFRINKAIFLLYGSVSHNGRQSGFLYKKP